MDRLDVFKALGDEDAVEENLSILEANYFVIGREEDGALVPDKVEVMVAFFYNLCFCRHWFSTLTNIFAMG